METRPYIAASANEWPGNDRRIGTARRRVWDSAQPVVIMSRCGESAGLFWTLYVRDIGSGFGGRRAARLLEGRCVEAAGRPCAVVHANGSTKTILDRVAPPSAADCPARGGLRTGE